MTVETTKGPEKSNLKRNKMIFRVAIISVIFFVFHVKNVLADQPIIVIINPYTMYEHPMGPVKLIELAKTNEIPCDTFYSDPLSLFFYEQLNNLDTLTQPNYKYQFSEYLNRTQLSFTFNYPKRFYFDVSAFSSKKDCNMIDVIFYRRFIHIPISWLNLIQSFIKKEWAKTEYQKMVDHILSL